MTTATVLSESLARLSATRRPTFRYFNTGTGWPGLQADGVAIGDDLELTLYRVPRVDDTFVGCIPSTREAMGPRGYRYATDSSEGTVTVVEPSSGQTVTTWAPFDQPEFIVANQDWVYVVEAGAEAITRLDADGVVDPKFWQNMSAWSGAVRVTVIFLVDFGDESRLVCVAADPDAGDTTRVLVVTLDGMRDDERTDAWNSLATRRRDPSTGSWWSYPVAVITGLAVDTANRRLLVVTGSALECFALDGMWIGTAETPDEWHSDKVFVVAGRCDSTWYVVTNPPQQGGEPESLTLNPFGAWTRVGTFVCGPVEPSQKPAVWRELRTRFVVPPGTTLRFWTRSQPTSVLDGDDLPGDLATSSTDTWTPVRGDLRGALVDSDPDNYLWLGGVLMSDGTAGPSISQSRVDIATSSWLSHLPAIYAEPGPPAEFLDRILRWMQSEVRDYEELLDALPVRFDYTSADDTDPGAARTALDELASWLGVVLDARWPQDRRRAVVGEAHWLHAMRGTADGLSRLLSLYLDATVEVFDMPSGTGLWVLDDTTTMPSALGLTTTLVASVPEGAVVDSTAIPGQSSLTDGSSYGAPVYDESAHLFCVRAYEADLPDPAERSALRDLVDTQKPAHLDYHLCLIGPRARVGFQARVGIDAVVAAPEGFVLDSASDLGVGSALDEIASPALHPRGAHAGTAVLGHGIHLT